MAAFVTDPGSFLWGATAVPNAFFCDYMPSAPEGYVKVYLYGYMAAQNGLGETVRMVEDLAIALGYASGKMYSVSGSISPPMASSLVRPEGDMPMRS